MRKLRFSSAALSGAGSAFLMDTTAISEPNLVPSDGFVHLIGTSQPDSDASIGVELEDKTMLACFLIIVTDVVATLQSVALIVLQNRGYSMLSLLLVSSLVGAFICGVLMITQGLPLVRDPKSRCALAERGLLGGVANLCAFVAVSTLNLGVASCLMFTMPLWTALLAYVLLGQKWKAHDVVLALSCLAGVLLVTDIWNANEGSSENDARTQWIGKKRILACGVKKKGRRRRKFLFSVLVVSNTASLSLSWSHSSLRHGRCAPLCAHQRGRGARGEHPPERGGPLEHGLGHHALRVRPRRFGCSRHGQFRVSHEARCFFFFFFFYFFYLF